MHRSMLSYHPPSFKQLLWRPRFLLGLFNANDQVNSVKRVDLGQIRVNLGHHLETLADNP
jgi:hypothetical protein